MKKSVKILGKTYNIDNTIFLDLSHEGLTEIPKGVNELINLEELWLNNNKIKKIENIDRLVKLKELYLYNNEIERIEGLENNKKLEILHIENNMIEKIENIHHLGELISFINSINEFITTEEAKTISLINERAKKLESI